MTTLLILLLTLNIFGNSDTPQSEDIVTAETTEELDLIQLDNSNSDYLVILEDEMILSKVKFTKTKDAKDFCSSEGYVMMDDPQILQQDLVGLIQVSIYLTEQSFSSIIDIISYNLSDSTGVWVIANHDRVVQWYDGMGYDFGIKKITELQPVNPTTEVAAPTICFSQELIDESNSI